MEDFEKILLDKIERSQALLANWRQSNNRMTDKEVLQQLNNILDNSVLAALKKRSDVRDILSKGTGHE
jgi:hypothetical protein